MSGKICWSARTVVEKIDLSQKGYKKEFERYFLELVDKKERKTLNFIVFVYKEAGKLFELVRLLTLMHDQEIVKHIVAALDIDTIDVLQVMMYPTLDTFQLLLKYTNVLQTNIGKYLLCYALSLKKKYQLIGLLCSQKNIDLDWSGEGNNALH